MTVPVPLAVRLSNASADQHITRRLRDLSFRSIVPGGFASASFSLEQPLAGRAPELAPFSRVYVYDTRTAETVWQGWLEEPGRGVGADGQVWNLSAIGPSARAQDKTEALVYIDSTLEPWHRTDNSMPGATASSGSNPADATDDQVLLFQFPNGSVLGTGYVVNLSYTVLTDAGLNLGGFGYTYDMGQTSVGYELHARVTGVTYKTTTFTTTRASITPASVDGAGSFTHGASTLGLRIYRAGSAGTVTSDTVWAAVSNLWVRGEIYGQDGVYIGGAGTYTNAFVYASEVVRDLLGRGLLSQYDAVGATVATTTFQIPQLAYPDGVTPAQVLDDLIALEPAYYWAAWEGDSARFEWAAWPTAVGYEASMVDGYSANNSTEGLYNRASVRWRDKKGGLHTSKYTQTVQVLNDAGIVRRAWIDLGDEAGHQANADRVGANFLADHAWASNAGSLTVARPIRNMLTGRMEQPWEIRPGKLLRLRGMPANPGPLNATGSDGYTVMRVVAVDYNASSNTATLELDTYSRTMMQAIRDRGRRR